MNTGKSVDEVPWWEETGMDGDGGVKTTETVVLGEQPFRGAGRGGAGRGGRMRARAQFLKESCLTLRPRGL